MSKPLKQKNFLIWQIISAFLICFLGNSCATLSGNREVVSIDSVPRGIDVYNADSDAYLGRTPFFAELKRSAKLNLKYKLFEKDKLPLLYSISCQYRWLGSLLGNFIFLPINPLLTATGLGVDFATGAAFEYPARIVITSHEDTEKLLGKQEKDHCRRVILIPPYYLGNKLAKVLQYAWLTYMRQKKNLCMEVFDEKSTLILLEQLNIGINKEINPKELSDHILTFLGYKANADLLINLRSEGVGDKWKLSPEFVDLHSHEAATRSDFGMEVAVRPEDTPSNLEKIFDFTYRIFPNSVRYGLDNTKLSANGKEGYHLASTREKRSIPQYLTSFDIATVNHSAAYEPWDVELGAYPSASAFYWNNIYTLKDANSLEIPNEISYFLATLLYSGEVSLHTPVGSFNAFLGLGPLLSVQKDNDEKREYRWLITRRAGIEYVAFIAKTIYIYLEAYALAIPAPASSIVGFEDEINHIGIGFGYFFNPSTILY